MLFLYLLTAGRTLSGLRGRGRWKYPVYCCHGSQSRPWEAGGRQPLFPEASCFPDGCWRSGRPQALKGHMASVLQACPLSVYIQIRI